MRFNCGKKGSSLERVKQWHRHFAWWPVKVAEYDCRWLEFVERRYPEAWIGPSSGNLWWEHPEYRAIKKVLDKP